MEVLLAISYLAFAPVSWGKVDLTTNYWLDTLLLGFTVKLDRAAHHSVIGESKRIHSTFCGAVDEPSDLTGRIKDAVLRVSM